MTGLTAALILILLGSAATYILCRNLPEEMSTEDDDGGPRHSMRAPRPDAPASYTPLSDAARALIAGTYYRESAPTFYAGAVA